MEDIIITIVAIAVGLGFKLIEKKLKSAGKSRPVEQPDWAKQLTEMFGSGAPEVVPTVEPQEDFAEPDDVQEPVAPSVVSEEPRSVGSEEAPRAVSPVNKPILVEEAPKKREKIDPKKLVVYSEIMKTKHF